MFGARDLNLLPMPVAHRAGMIPMRSSTIFKSRYMALLWAAGIVWFAYDVAAPDAPAGNDAGLSNAEMAQLPPEQQQALTTLATFGK